MFLHTYEPNRILFSLGPINIYWYGFFIVLGIVCALLLSSRLAKYFSIIKDDIFDLGFWLLLYGLAGARIMYVLFSLPYYLKKPWEIFYLWQGGLAIQGAILAGIAAIYWWSKKNKVNFLKIISLSALVMPLAQALGRWGNYFNQELFGTPTDLPWGIPINYIMRPEKYLNAEYFHPAFLYESLGNLIIFGLLLYLFFYFIKKEKNQNLGYQLIILGYLSSYSLLRFLVEFIRTDTVPLMLEIRLTQIISGAMLLTCLSLGYYLIKKRSFA